MKILKDNEYAALKIKADNYDTVVNGMVEAGENLSAEDITPASILEAMEPADNTEGVDVSELNQQINALTTERDNAVTRAEAAEARVSELEEIPAEEPVGGKSPKKEESDAVSVDEANNYIKSQKDFASSIEMARKLL